MERDEERERVGERVRQREEREREMEKEEGEASKREIRNEAVMQLNVSAALWGALTGSDSAKKMRRAPLTLSSFCLSLFLSPFLSFSFTHLLSLPLTFSPFLC